MSKQRVLITGGASGIGLAMARAFLNDGAVVTLADRDIEQAELSRAALQSDLGEAEQRVWALGVDVVEADEVEQVVAEAARTMDGLDVVIANAGIGIVKTFLETTPEEYEAVHAVNSRGVFHSLRAGTLEMIAQDTGGALLVNASVTGLRASAYRTAYGSSKAAVINLTQIAALELASQGIRVNALCPGPVDTPLTREMHDSATRAEWEEPRANALLRHPRRDRSPGRLPGQSGCQLHHRSGHRRRRWLDHRGADAV